MAFKSGSIRTYSRKKATRQLQETPERDRLFNQLLSNEPADPFLQSENAPSPGPVLKVKPTSKALPLSDVSNLSNLQYSYALSSHSTSTPEKNTKKEKCPKKRKSRKKKPKCKNDDTALVDSNPSITISSHDDGVPVNIENITCRRRHMKSVHNVSLSSSYLASNESSGSSNRSQSLMDAGGTKSESLEPFRSNKQPGLVKIIRSGAPSSPLSECGSQHDLTPKSCHSSLSSHDNSNLHLDTISIDDMSQSMQEVCISVKKKKSSISAISTPSSSDYPQVDSPTDVSPVISNDAHMVALSPSLRSPPFDDTETQKLTVNAVLTKNDTNDSLLSSSIKWHDDPGPSVDSESHQQINLVTKSPLDSASSSDQHEDSEHYSGSEPTSVGSNVNVLSATSSESIIEEINIDCKQKKSPKMKVNKDPDDCGGWVPIIRQHEECYTYDESFAQSSQNPSEANLSALTQRLSELPFKKPFSPLRKPVRKPKREPLWQVPTINEESESQWASNPRLSILRDSKLNQINQTNFEETLFGDATFSQAGNLSILNGSALFLESGKKWRRSFLKARRETNRYDVSRAHDHGCEKIDENDVSTCEVPEESTICDTTRILTLDDLLLKVSAKDYLLRRCNQTEAIPFSQLFPEKSLENSIKVGEGVFGEVFLLGEAEDFCVIKIIPIEGDLIVNEERQKKFEEVLSEVVTAQELSNLRHGSTNKTANFCEVLQCKCVYGQYPEELLRQWDLYHAQKRSYNDSPVIFEDDQLYIVLKLGNAGKDLECFRFTSAYQSYSALLQISMALAVAERALQFEHRDLHWGNVLLSPTKERRISYMLDDVEYEIPSHGVKATIIDFTLSRITFKAEQNDYVVFFNLGCDPELFQSEGDYQFEMYRMMKNEVQDVWHMYKPRNNIFWLHYLVDKMIGSCYYKNITTTTHKKYMLFLDEINESILKCSDTFDFINSFSSNYSRSLTG